MIAGILKRRGMNDFVSGNFPEPMNPLYLTVQPNWDQMPGMGNLEDFVPANFPEPHNPIGGMGSMGCGGGCGGTCADCGMGALAVPAWAMALPAPLNGVDPAFSIPWVYWGIGGVAALVVLPMVFGRKGRR